MFSGDAIDILERRELELGGARALGGAAKRLLRASQQLLASLRTLAEVQNRALPLLRLGRVDPPRDRGLEPRERSLLRLHEPSRVLA